LQNHDSSNGPSLGRPGAARHRLRRQRSERLSRGARGPPSHRPPEGRERDATNAAGAARGGGGGGAGAARAPGEPPPEKEVESDYEAPVATGHFVWIANPKSGRVAFVDATTLQVKTVQAGNA